MQDTHNVCKDLVINIENSCSDLFRKFREKQLKATLDKIQLLTSTRQPIKINIEGNYSNSSNEEKLICSFF